MMGVESILAKDEQQVQVESIHPIQLDMIQAGPIWLR